MRNQYKARFGVSALPRFHLTGGEKRWDFCSLHRTKVASLVGRGDESKRRREFRVGGRGEEGSWRWVGSHGAVTEAARKRCPAAVRFLDFSWRTTVGRGSRRGRPLPAAPCWGLGFRIGPRSLGMEQTAAARNKTRRIQWVVVTNSDETRLLHWLDSFWRRGNFKAKTQSLKDITATSFILWKKGKKYIKIRYKNEVFIRSLRTFSHWHWPVFF